MVNLLFEKIIPMIIGFLAIFGIVMVLFFAVLINGFIAVAVVNALTMLFGLGFQIVYNIRSLFLVGLPVFLVGLLAWTVLCGKK